MKAAKFLLLFCLILSACSPALNDANPVNHLPAQVETQTEAPAAAETPTPIPPANVFATTSSTDTPQEYPTAQPGELTLSTTPPTVPTFGPDDWKNLPIIPVISPKVREIYRQGIELGNDPQAFSKIGDCGSTPAWFLGDFDRGPRFYQLGDYEYLSNVIQVFKGSFNRTSLAAKSGFNASSIFSPLWSNLEQCPANETPLACEYRVQKPTFAFIMLGSNDVYHPDEFAPQMRKIIDYSIGHGVVPILSTKADNLEGDGRINATIAQLAQEYDIPLWNYWRAVQELPDQGLQEDKVHITWAPNRFNDPHSMARGWPVRNLNALQVLDALWQAVSAEDATQ